MSYRAIGKFGCDGCKVIDSRDIEVASDAAGSELPYGWLRCETMLRRSDLTITERRHYCPSCTPLILSYLNGRVSSDGGHA